MNHTPLTRMFALPQQKPEASRRAFLKLSGGAGAGLILGLAAPLPKLGATAEAAATTNLMPNPFVIVAPDDTVTVLIKHLDKGQGAATGLATLVADELDADWSKVKTEFAPSDPEKYKNLAFGVQGVGGSTGLANSYMQYRTAGATAKAMLVAAASRAWGVPASEIKVANSVVSHASGKSATFGELADKAAAESVPDKPALKEAKDFTLIGKKTHRVDSTAKTLGQAKYTIDQFPPNVMTAVMVRPPKFGGKVKSFDGSATEKVAGVIRVVQVPRGVAVVARNTWAALKGREALKVEWDLSAAETRSTDQMLKDYKALLDKEGLPARKDGDIEAGFKAAAQTIEADFEFPYLAHAPMEPMNAVVRFDGSKAEVWTGSQMQTLDHGTTAGIFKLKPESVQIHTLWAGGSFGRRAIADCHYVAEACEIVKAMKTADPVKLIWTRDDDITGGYYRPMYVHRIKAGIDKDGKLVAWLHRIVGQSILDGTPFASQMIKDGIDGTSVEGAATLPYAIANLKVELTTVKSPVPVLWWRSVGATHTAHATEHMIDIVARAAGKDPVAYRLDMLKDKPRHAGALKLAAEKAGWGTPPPEGVYRGVALHESFASYVANIADVRLRDDGSVKVEKVVCAIDCGIAVNPDVVEAQMEGGLGYGLGAALKGAITLKDGEIEQKNFDSYEVLRISEMPKVETYIVASAEAPTGVGEPGTPVVLPAVANALLGGTGVRTTVLPINRQKYKTQA